MARRTLIHSRLILAVAVAALMFAASGARAQTAPRYQTWTDPNAAAETDARMQALIERLERLITEAERQRAADPRFLSDLKAALRQSERPWSQTILTDDFADGDFTRNPAWQVTAGQFTVERGYGLRSIVEVAAQSQGGAPSDSRRDITTAIIGNILNQALPQKGAQPERGGTSGLATILAPGRLPTAFAIQFELTSWKQGGGFEIGVYQGSGEGPGYRLAYRSGQTPGLELQRVSGRGAAVIESLAQAVPLEDQRVHALEWTRNAAGEMTVSLDGKPVLRASDRAVRDAFDGVRIANRGGDFIVKRITVLGAP